MVAAAAGEPVHRRAFAMARQVVRGLFVHHAFDHAATMAFYFFLGSIPALVFVGLALGSVVPREGVEELAAPLYDALPLAAAELVRNELRRVAAASTRSLAPLSLLGFLWLTTNGVHNLMDVFEMLVGARRRPWFRQRFVATLWVIGGLGSVAAATWVLIALGTGGWQRFGGILVFAGMLSLALATFYRTGVRHPPNIRRRVWPGTLVALVLWMLVSWVFGTYVRTIAHYAIFYGSLATVAVVLLWLYLTALALLVGAEVNVHLEGIRDLKPPVTPVTP
jgi:membrane protein